MSSSAYTMSYEQILTIALQTTTEITVQMQNETSATTSPVPDDRVDYIRVGVLTLMFVIGVPLNLRAFQNLNEPAAHYFDDRMTLLRRHLNFSDLFIMFVFTPTSIWWSINRRWQGGAALCKSVKFLHSLSFYVSSNVIVCIALNRLATMIWPGLPQKRAKRLVTLMLSAAWAISVIESLPQLWVYTVHEQFKNWPQCTRYWDVTLWRRGNLNYSAAVAALPSFTRHLHDFYSIYALLFVFWLPALICSCCYIVIAVYLCRASRQRKITIKRNRRAQMSTGKPPALRVMHCDTQHAPTSPNHTVKLIEVSDEHPNDHNNDVSTRSSYLSNGHHSTSSRFKAALNNLFAHHNHTNDCATSVPHSPLNAKKSLATLRRTAAGVSLLLVVAYIVCWLPYNLVQLWVVIDADSFRPFADYVRWTTSLIVLNSLVNPLLYRTAQHNNQLPVL